jgi:hypothetical protein
MLWRTEDSSAASALVSRVPLGSSEVADTTPSEVATEMNNTENEQSLHRRVRAREQDDSLTHKPQFWVALGTLLLASRLVDLAPVFWSLLRDGLVGSLIATAGGQVVRVAAVVCAAWILVRVLFPPSPSRD